MSKMNTGTKIGLAVLGVAAVGLVSFKPITKAMQAYSFYKNFEVSMAFKSINVDKGLLRISVDIFLKNPSNFSMTSIALPETTVTLFFDGQSVGISNLRDKKISIIPHGTSKIDNVIFGYKPNWKMIKILGKSLVDYAKEIAKKMQYYKSSDSVWNKISVVVNNVITGIDAATDTDAVVKYILEGNETRNGLLSRMSVKVFVNDWNLTFEKNLGEKSVDKKIEKMVFGQKC